MTDRKRITSFIKVWVAIGAILIILGYAAFQAKNLVKGPAIAVESPKDGESFSNGLIEIRGEAKNLSYLTLNGDKIFTDEKGAFDERILLSPGYNVVTLKAQDRFGRATEERLQVTYQ